MRVSDFAASTDPIDRLVARGVPVRALVALELGGVEWLALHQDERFRLCYYDEDGAVATQDVDAVGLVLRARELGWTAMRDLQPGPDPWIFDQATYHFRRGVHWYASATDETDDMLPLAFPAGVLKRAAKAQARQMAAAKKARDAEAKAAARSRKREDREARAWLIEYSAQCHLDRAKSKGAPLSPAQAKKTARRLVDQVVSRIEARKRERGSSLEGSEDEVR
ncbi:hypothetical protein QE424_000405 [Stenotrophomonas rhizophila]|uniref:Uncharacterized protein n=1 Tax=Stenotrophomonas rhizophila TaxID=216778 RepID=A0AAP5AFF1_9GAMM|nr:hypothetical protein [Stenotrophomonas rhizophila]MDQ1107246.1 hypothetical protein [Stenotrophomonas rhizophila]